MQNNVELLVDELIVNNINCEAMHWVDVTHIINPTDFYVRPVRFNFLVKHYETVTSFIITSPLKENDLVLYNKLYLKRGVKYIRAKITKLYTDFEECDIFAIDYGFTKKRVSIEHLMECPPELLDTPGLAFSSLLCNCHPINHEKGWTRFTICAFTQYLKLGRAKMTILGRTTRQLIINLMNVDLEDVATLLAIKGYSKLGAFNSCTPWRPLIIRRRHKFNYKKLHVGDTFRVRMLWGDSLKLFYVKEVKDYETFLENVGDISFYARQQYPLLVNHLIEGTVVCVKNIEQNTYDRAFIKHVTAHGQKAVLHLVDWGRDEEFTIDKIKYMPKEALTTTMTTIMCSVSENQASDNRFKEFLKPGFEFYIKIKTLGHEFERENEVEILPIEEVEKEVGATCLGYNDCYIKCKEPKPVIRFPEFEEESLNLKPQNTFPEIPMEEESVEQLVTWIKGMGIKRPNVKPRFKFIIIKKYTDVKDFSTEAGYYAFISNPSDTFISHKEMSSRVQTEIQNTSEEIQGESQNESLLSTSGDIEDTNISKTKPKESSPKSDDEELLPSNATATIESDASHASNTTTEF